MALDLLTTIELDMQNPYSSSSIVHVNQYDTAGRIKAQLLNGGVNWQVPQGAKPVVMFKKTDNIGGFYDVTELNPSTAAVTVDGSDSSIIYITLDQQTTTTATPTGQYVNMQVAFYQNGARLSTFAFHMQVAESVVTSGDIHSNWLFNILSQEIAQILTDATTPEFIENWLENNITQETGYVIDDSLTIHGAASDAQATGKMVTVSDTNPGVAANKVWVKKTPSEIVVPTEDEVEDLRNTLNYVNPLVNEYANAVNKYYSINDGWSNSGTRISLMQLYANERMYLYAATGYQLIINFFDSSWNLIEAGNNWGTSAEIPEGSYYSITIRKPDNSAIDPSEILNVYSYNMTKQKAFQELVNKTSTIYDTFDHYNVLVDQYQYAVKQYYFNQWNPASNRVSIKQIIAAEKTYLYANSGYELFINKFDSSWNFIEADTEWRTSTIIESGTYYSVTVKKSDDSTISLDAILNIYSFQVAKETSIETLQSADIRLESGIKKTNLNGTYFKPVESHWNYVSSFSTSTTRMSFDNPVPVPSGYSVEIMPANGEDGLIYLFDKVGNSGNINSDYANGEFIAGWFSSKYIWVNRSDTLKYAFVEIRNHDNSVIDTVSSQVVIASYYDRSDLVPNYYTSHLESKESIITGREKRIGYNGDEFVFITDMHWGANAKKSPVLIKHLLNNTSLNMVVNCGDFVSSKTLRLSEYRSAWHGLEPLSARGNHDKNPDYSDVTDIIYDSEFYGIVLKPYESLMSVYHQLYYYHDNDAQKIRYFFLDSGREGETLDATQLTWFETNIKSLQSDWKAIVFIHICLKAAKTSIVASYDEAVTPFISKLNTIWDQITCRFLGILCGHAHKDLWFIDPIHGFPIMSTSCDARGTTRTDYDTINTDDTINTVNEQLFDVCNIDTYNEELFLTRIGAGGNRHLIYGFTVIEVGNTHTFTPTITNPIWSIANESNIATVSDGVVTAVSQGFCLVTCRDSTYNQEAWVVKIV